MRKSTMKQVLLLAVVLMFSVTLLVACSEQPNLTPTSSGNSQHSEGLGQTEPLEEPALPLPTNYIVLTCPADLKDDVNVRCEDLKDGQQIVFMTDLAGEELELFRFSISTSVDDGFLLGVLEDEVSGSLMVCVHVQEYQNGNWKPEDFNRLNSLQERVNDIIIQFYEDERFVPNR